MFYSGQANLGEAHFPRALLRQLSKVRCMWQLSLSYQVSAAGWLLARFSQSTSADSLLNVLPFSSSSIAVTSNRIATLTPSPIDLPSAASSANPPHEPTWLEPKWIEPTWLVLKWFPRRPVAAAPIPL